MQDLPELDWDTSGLPWLDAAYQNNTFMQHAMPGNTFALSHAPPTASKSYIAPLLAPTVSPDQLETSDAAQKAPKKARSAYATSCASCRLRKVKCIRSDPDGPCDSCAKKDIRCVSVDAPLNKKKNGSGRSGNRPILVHDRIEFAKQHFGEADLPTQHIPSISPSSEESAPTLSPSSVAARMDEVQVSACFCSALVDSYFSCPYFAQPCLDWTELRHRFTSVGYRLQEISPANQALMAVVIATASRVAMHEDIIGQSHMTDMTVLPLKPGVDLSTYGKKRDATCRALEREARKKIIQPELLLQPSPEVVAALYLEFTLQNSQALPLPIRIWVNSRVATYSSDGHEGKQLLSIAASHLRSLHEKEGNESRLYSDHVNLTLCVADTMTAARTGAAFALTDDDVKLFLRSATYKDTEVSEELVHTLIANPTWPNSYCITQPVWYGFIKMSRKLVSTVTGPLARTSPLDVQAVLDFWSTWDKLWSFSAYARVHLEANLHLGQPIQVASQHLEMTKCAFLHGLMACDHALAKRANGAIVSSSEQDALQDLRATSKKRMIQGSKDLADHLELLAGISSNITLASTVQILQMNFDEWASLLQEAPTASEGGPAECDDAAKIRGLNAYITTYKALSYSWPQFEASATSLTASRDQLNDRLLYKHLFSTSPSQQFVEL